MEGYEGRSNFVPQKIIREFWTRDATVTGSTWALGWDTPSAEHSSSGHRFSAGAVGHLGFTGTSIWIEPESEIAISYAVFCLKKKNQSGGPARTRVDMQR